ncbi:MAG: ATP-binding protein [Propionibacteriaceae bacterium]|jgi:hypothetical protein|nr:ATP-binding protein [Propionibacteriaceae bacterium]
MTKYYLDFLPEHVERSSVHRNDPVKAVFEIIWNCLDADAHAVVVALKRNEAGGITGVSIKDDGHGITPEAAISEFKPVGPSWKSTPRSVSKKEGRPLHGKHGEGRLRAFALGQDVQWVSIAEDTGKIWKETTIQASGSELLVVDISDKTTTSRASGTHFTTQDGDRLGKLEAEAMMVKLTNEFAAYLLSFPSVSISYEGRTIDPKSVMRSDFVSDLAWEFGGVEHRAEIRIIEWQDNRGRVVYLADQSGIPLEKLDKSPASDFSYAAYIMWEDMPEHRGEWLLEKLETEPSILHVLLDMSLTFIKDYFSSRRAERRREIVDQWKRDKTYPYDAEPATPEDQVEQAMFDVVATAVHSNVPNSPNQQRMTLTLLKEALQKRPDNLTSLLDQYLNLSLEEREQLEYLLGDIGLSRIIRATANVSDRFRFLRGLELMIDDPEANKLIRERDHLHKILEHELWVFGEQFNSMISERGLTAVRDRHRDVLGLEPVSGSVRRADGSLGRVDLLLSATTRESGRNRHLVVELKAPSVDAKSEELTQLHSYAEAVARDSHFGGVQVLWEFYLVTARIHSSIVNQTRQSNRPPGLVSEFPLDDGYGSQIRVWVKTWAEIIEDNRQRLNYYQEHLQTDHSLEDAKEYLVSHYPTIIPEAFMLETDPEGT